MPAPVSFFVYNRPEHTKKTLDALANNALADETNLFIFSDGPKNNASADEIKKINMVRQIIRNENRFKEINISESIFNKGLSNSIIPGVTNVINKYGRVIVLEDDILTNKYFLKFCNEALDRYELEDQVKAISGYSFPIKNKLHTAFFSTWISCWGWATWERSWSAFEPDALKLINQIEGKRKIKEFNFNNSFDSYELLQAQIEKRVDSWAVRWLASVFLSHGLMLYPPSSLTMNIGMDGSGTHFNYDKDDNKISNVTDSVILKNNFNASNNFFPAEIKPDKRLEKQLQKYFRKESFKRPIDKIKRILKNILPKRIFTTIKKLQSRPIMNQGTE